MKIAVARESREGESRVAMVPELVSKLTDLGYEVLVEPEAGARAEYADELYVEAGATVTDDALAEADVVLGVNALSSDRARRLREGTATMSFLPVNSSHDLVTDLRDLGITSFALELVPRISRAQSMDALSSQALVSGYRCAIVAAGLLRRFFPLNMTAAGTVQPAQVVVLGAGVAGLQAIATAKRLGAVVHAYDVRAAAAEEIRSMGAKSIDLELETLEGSGGYAREMTEDRADRQREMLAPYIADADALITTAAVPGRQAPMLVTAEMVEQMKPGSVVVDLAAESGGNVQGSVAGKVVRIGHAQVWGGENVPSQMPGPASKLYAQNLVSLLTLMTSRGRVRSRLRGRGRRGRSGDARRPDHARADPGGHRGTAARSRHHREGGFETVADAPSSTTENGADPTSPAARSPLRPGGRQVSEAVVWLTIFILSVFVGIEVISKVSSTLHTPLMSGANAIHGIILLGAIIVTGTTENGVAVAIGLVAIVLAAVNMVGGFVVTDRMLQMFTRKKKKPVSTSRRGGNRQVTPTWVQLTYLACAVCFILALKGLSGPKTARTRQPDRRSRRRGRVRRPVLLPRPVAHPADPGRDRRRHRRWRVRRPAGADDPDAADGGAVQRRRWRRRGAGRAAGAARDRRASGTT